MTTLHAAAARRVRRTIHDRVRALAEQWPDRAAFQYLDGRDQKTISAGELARRSAQHCSWYAQQGGRRGDAAIIVLRHDERLLYAYFGAMMGGIVPSILPYPTAKLDPQRYAASMSALVARIKPRILIAADDLVQRFRETIPSGVGARVLAAPSQDERDGLEEHGGTLTRASDVALLQHSSGTTGLQKGVALTHEQVVSQVDHYSDAIGLVESDAIVSWLPLYHDMGLIACTMLPAMRGVETFWMSPLEWIARPTMLLDVISQQRATLCWQPNFAFSLLARRTSSEEAAKFDLSSMRAWINCSEPVSATTMDEFLGRFGASGVVESSLAACYAMAENVFAVTQTEIGQPLMIDHVDGGALQDGMATPWEASRADRPRLRRLVSSGRVVEGTSLRVLDSRDNDVPDRTVGELVVAGDCAFHGYSGDERRTKASSGAEPFRTGDLGYVADGYCYVTGRVKDMIIIAGRNIYPHDVEAIAGSVGGVTEGRAAAIGRYDAEIGTERLVVLVETRLSEPHRAALASRVREAILTELDCPVDHVVLLEPGALLKTSSGKVSRAANADRFAARMAQT